MQPTEGGYTYDLRVSKVGSENWAYTSNNLSVTFVSAGRGQVIDVQL